MDKWRRKFINEVEIRQATITQESMLRLSQRMARIKVSPYSTVKLSHKTAQGKDRTFLDSSRSLANAFYGPAPRQMPDELSNIHAKINDTTRNITTVKYQVLKLIDSNGPNLFYSNIKKSYEFHQFSSYLYNISRKQSIKRFNSPQILDSAKSR